MGLKKVLRQISNFFAIPPTIVTIEGIPHPNSTQVEVEFLSGDTIRIVEGVNKGSVIRLATFNAREPVECISPYLFIDEYSKAYLWCKVGNDYIPYRHIARIDSDTYSPPELYPYYLWRKNAKIIFRYKVQFVVNNILCGNNCNKIADEIELLAGFYKVNIEKKCYTVDLITKKLYEYDDFDERLYPRH